MDKFKEYFQKYFVDLLKNHYADFKGRASRAQYWYFVLFYVLVSIVFSVVDAIVFQGQVLTLILSLAMIVPSIAVGVRRLHDLGKSGWWFFIAFVPFVGLIALLVLFCLKGEDKANAYGPKA